MNGNANLFNQSLNFKHMKKDIFETILFLAVLLIALKLVNIVENF
jgi:hypothetical protein